MPKHKHYLNKDIRAYQTTFNQHFNAETQTLVEQGQKDLLNNL